MRPSSFLIAGAAAVALAIGMFSFQQFWKSNPDALTGGLGVPFNLVDDQGEAITEQAFVGHPSMLYFGYTHCPDVCPTTLFEMAEWMNTLGEANGLHGYFVTVDPERDSGELMHSYVSAFTDRITGITGDAEELAKVIKGWRVYAARVPGEEPGDYTMDHTASVFLLSSDGRFKGTISYGEDRDVALEKLRNLIKE